MHGDFDEEESDLKACAWHGSGSLAVTWCLWVSVERGNVGGDGDVMRQCGRYGDCTVVWFKGMDIKGFMVVVVVFCEGCWRLGWR